MTSDVRPRPARQDHDLDVLLSTPVHQHMGLRAADPRDHDAGIVLEVIAELVNNSGMLHGGLVATSIDVACAYAIFPSLADHEVVLTNSLAVSYLRPIPLGSTVTVRAEIVRRGRSIAFLRADVLVDTRIMATAQVVKSVISLED